MKKKDSENNYIEIETRVIPKSSRNEIIIEENDLIKIKITSPPVDGKANKAVTELLSKKLRVPKKNVQIVSGEKSRQKRIRVYDVTFNEIAGISKQ